MAAYLIRFTGNSPSSQGRQPDKRLKRRNVVPGMGLTLGYTVAYLSLLVLIPLAMLPLKVAGMGWTRLCDAIVSPRLLAAFELSFGAALVGALVDTLFGVMVAWSLVRYQLPFRDIIDSLVDLPFALPTAVAGIALTAIYSQNGWIGRLAAPLGIRIAFTPLGVVVALTFIGLPFVVRTVQPVLADLDRELEEAAATLGATRAQTFVHVIAPALLPATVTGFTLAFARALGEYGSVVFISGNMPMRTEVVPLLIMTKLEEFDYQGAAAIALVMLLVSFTMLLGVNLLQRWSATRDVLG
jgi:sulfate/thiosulfate transport system permease protein